MIELLCGPRTPPLIRLPQRLQGATRTSEPAQENVARAEHPPVSSTESNLQLSGPDAPAKQRTR